jgi:hypothetical protein
MSVLIPAVYGLAVLPYPVIFGVAAYGVLAPGSDTFEPQPRHPRGRHGAVAHRPRRRRDAGIMAAAPIRSGGAEATLPSARCSEPERSPEEVGVAQ